MSEAPGPSALVILLGASDFPNSKGLTSSQAFQKSHQALKQYLVDPEGFALVGEAGLLDLFDSDEASPVMITRISAWLTLETEKRRAKDQSVQDVILFYIGHGGFRDNSKDYFLAIKGTNDDDP